MLRSTRLTVAADPHRPPPPKGAENDLDPSNTRAGWHRARNHEIRHSPRGLKTEPELQRRHVHDPSPTRRAMAVAKKAQRQVLYAELRATSLI